MKTAQNLVEDELYKRRIVAIHYQHVDGTSFAAPIAPSAIAQMLEANPGLTPAMIKNLVISTASRLSGFPSVRQGFGILNPRKLVEESLGETHFFDHSTLAPPRIEKNKVIFRHHDDAIEMLHLAGDFNGWSSSATPFVKFPTGLWQSEIPIPVKNRYAYKFVADGWRWIEDPSHGLKVDDGFNGFNSILEIV